MVYPAAVWGGGGGGGGVQKGVKDKSEKTASQNFCVELIQTRREVPSPEGSEPSSSWS